MSTKSVSRICTAHDNCTLVQAELVAVSAKSSFPTILLLSVCWRQVRAGMAGMSFG